MSNRIGINQIGSIDFNSIIAGDFPRVTEEVTAGEDLVLGTLARRDEDGTLKVWRNTDDTVHAVVAEDITEGNVGVAWLTGEFVGPRVTVADGADWEDAVDDARTKSIFLKSARLAPNQ